MLAALVVAGACLLLGHPARSHDPAGPSALRSADGRYPEWVDRAISPAQDFFLYANGNWLKSNPIPPDRSYWGVDTVLEEGNQVLIRDLLVSLADAPASAADGVQRKAGDFYASGMDEAAIERAGTAPLGPELERIAAMRSLGDLNAELCRLQLLGVGAPFQLGQMQDFRDSSRVIAVASQGGLGLPNRDYYLKNDAVFAATRREYVLHVARMLSLLGDPAADARREADAIMTLETRLARASMPDAKQRDPAAVYHPLELARAHGLAPSLDWQGMLRAAGHPEVGSLNVAMPEFFRALDRELGAEPLEHWKSYLRWQLVDAYAPFMPAAFVNEDFHMRSVLNGARELQPRWLRVLAAEDEALGFAVGEMYVARRFPPAAKHAASDMVERIRAALKTDLETLAWMTPATRLAAARKLEQMQLRIGYPDRPRDYSGLQIDRGPYLGNMMRAREFEQRRQFGKIGKPVDRSDWSMTPQTVNAYYDASMNSLTVPAGILQPPYFDVSWPDAVNYGATGAGTVGHEMTHGFDDEGARFDGMGNLKDWWAPDDLRKFRAATQCIARQYSRYTVAGGLHVQGDLVTGEAAADLGGVILALRALHALPAAAPGEREAADREFFMAFAHSWAGALRPEQAREQVTADPHPPAEFRTNGTLADDPAFQAAFDIPTSSPMVKRDRCVIW
jgi:putative endopeptidase